MIIIKYFVIKTSAVYIIIHVDVNNKIQFMWQSTCNTVHTLYLAVVCGGTVLPPDFRYRIAEQPQIKFTPEV